MQHNSKSSICRAAGLFMQVHLTYDIEIRFNSWTDWKGRSFVAFPRLPHGPLPHQRRAVVLVEPLFSNDYGLDNLQELTGLFRCHGGAPGDRFFGCSGRRLDRYCARAKMPRRTRGHG